MRKGTAFSLVGFILGAVGPLCPSRLLCSAPWGVVLSKKVQPPARALKAHSAARQPEENTLFRLFFRHVARTAPKCR